MSELPDGWIKVPLGEVNEFSGSTVNPASRPDELFELYSVPSFPKGKPERLLGGEIGSTKQTVEAGDVLISKINPRINRVWTVGSKSSEEQIASSEWIGFRSEAVKPAFANYYFRSQEFRDLLCSEVAGVGGSLTRAQPKRVAAYPLPIAPLAEQTRIADQLDTLLARVNACNEHLDAIPGILKRFRQAVIRTAMTGGLSDSSAEVLSQEWTTSTIGGVTVDLRYGTSKKCDYGVEGVGVLRIPNITPAGGVSQSDLKSAQFDEQETKKLALKAGDLLVIRSNGSLDLVGRCGLVSEKDEGLLFAGYLMRLRVNTELVRPAFILHWLMATDQRKRIELLAKSTSGVNNLNAEELRSLPLRFPTLPEQNEILRKIEAYMACADRIEARYTAMRAHAQRLAPQVLAKAFRGELVEQDPNDEAADELLARLRTQRATSSTEKAPRRPRQIRTTRTPVEASSMTKSRQDEDVKGHPYLAGHLRRIGVPATAQALFKEAELPVADFYKQLAWEIAEGHVKDNETTLEPGHAAG